MGPHIKYCFSGSWWAHCVHSNKRETAIYKYMYIYIFVHVCLFVWCFQLFLWFLYVYIYSYICSCVFVFMFLVIVVYYCSLPSVCSCLFVFMLTLFTGHRLANSWYTPINTLPIRVCRKCKPYHASKAMLSEAVKFLLILRDTVPGDVHQTVPPTV